MIILSKKLLIILIFLFTISVSCSSSICVDFKKASPDNDADDVISEFSGSKDENVNIHKFCYIKSGNVEHRNLDGHFFCIPVVTGSDLRHFGIGSFSIQLKGGGVRLTVSKIFRKTTYKEDVIVSVKGFIGMVQPTGGLSYGFLSGYTFITSVTQLKKIDHSFVNSSESSSLSISSAIFANFTN